MRTSAQAHSTRVTRRPASRALSGRANSSADTSSGATSSSDPNASAMAWNTYPVIAAPVPAHHRGRRSNVVTITALTP